MRRRREPFHSGRQACSGPRRPRFLPTLLTLLLIVAGDPARAIQETPSLVPEVAAGRLPPIARRVPAEPLLVDLAEQDKSPGRHGGTLRMLVGSGDDARSLVPFGYSRLVAYDESYRLVPDILRSVDVVEGRIFTLHLRRGHRWSDGAPFTTEDFRYWWEDVANNEELTPDGLPSPLLVNGTPPRVEIIDPLTIRFSWGWPNQAFLPALARASPLMIYRPAHYLKQFHIAYADAADLAGKVAEAKVASWAELHRRRDTPVTLANPELPTLQPWISLSHPLGSTIEMQRNPYYHRIDGQGRQLPFLDAIVLSAVPREEIPARTAAGESDLQATGLGLDHLPILREAEAKGTIALRLWPGGRGTQYALYPNLNAADPVLRKLLRDVRFRRALSLATDREAVDQAIFHGEAMPRANTVLPGSPLFDPDNQIAWTSFDPARADELLNALDLKRDPEGLRRLPDGRRLSLVVATAGTDPTELAVLQLVQQSWRRVGIEMLIEASDPETFRKRLLSGEIPISIGPGLATGLVTPAMSPHPLAPSSAQQRAWPQWGLYMQTGGTKGKPIDLAEAGELADLYASWRDARSEEEKAEIWRRMLEIHSEQVFTIGIVGEVPQPIAASPRLRNLPERDYYNWEPGAYFGIYRPDTFWLE